jgi:ATP synthase protein I
MDEIHKGKDARLEALEAEIARAQAQAGVAPRSAPQTEAQESERMGGRVLSELVGAPFGAGLIGWLIDSFAGSSPWGLLIFLVIGIIIAARNIYQLAQRANSG